MTFEIVCFRHQRCIWFVRLRRYLSEKDRQAALVRLRQSRLRAQEEERYDAAALVSGLIEREAKESER